MLEMTPSDSPTKQIQYHVDEDVRIELSIGPAGLNEAQEMNDDKGGDKKAENKKLELYKTLMQSRKRLLNVRHADGNVA